MNELEIQLSVYDIYLATLENAKRHGLTDINRLIENGNSLPYKTELTKSFLELLQFSVDTGLNGIDDVMKAITIARVERLAGIVK